MQMIICRRPLMSLSEVMRAVPCRANLETLSLQSDKDIFYIAQDIASNHTIRYQQRVDTMQALPRNVASRKPIYVSSHIHDRQYQ